MDEVHERAWRGFKPGPWQTRINVRDFIQRNYTPYEGDASFLAGATERTRKVWEKLVPLLAEETKKGVLAVSQEPSSILAHGPGYIDKDLELIVGLQTEAPLKRAIMPKGGWRMVEMSLKAYGFEPDPAIKKIFTEHVKTHKDGVFDGAIQFNLDMISREGENLNWQQLIADTERIALQMERETDLARQQEIRELRSGGRRGP